MGYPARDTRHDMAVLSRVFGDVYGILRLQPGQVLEEKAEELLVVHNCFTAGGNGGSALIDIETGEVLGLHFAGWYRPGSAGFKQGHAIATYRLAQHPLLVSNGVFGIRADDQRETTFVDRVAEQDVFRHMLFQQRGQVLFVRGWAGMGKTALLRRYAQMAAENGMRTVFLRGRGDLPFASSLDDAAWSLAAPVILIDNADEYPSSLIANLIENVLANDTQLRVLVVAGRDFNTPRQYARHVDVLVLELKPLPRRVVAEWLDAQKLDTTPEVIETITSMSGGVPAMVATLIANLGNVLSDRPDIRDIERRIGLRTVSVTSPTDKAIVFQDDGWETHGRFVVTRGIHTLTVPSHYKIGQYLLTNGVYDEFVRAGGYRYKEFWGTVPASTRKSFTCRDGTPGPATWPSANVEPQSAEYPVTGISYFEAVAFIAWLGLNRAAPDGMQWCLPSENMWEFAARGEEGLRYPWGPEFEEGRCNSAEAGLNATSPAGNFPEGKSPFGAHDMAGNVWEFVRAFDHDQTSCVLRGGSFKNTRDEVKSTLRLVKVPRHHRPPDFGFRVALEPRGSTDAAPPKR
jgi:formylglycine-generating enzyme required for sulfatase activity